MKKALCALAALLLILSLGHLALAEGENLLTNGDFSDVKGDLPRGWRRDMWLTDTGVSVLTVDEDGYEGNCVTVTNVDENDARFAQAVKVEPDTLYRVSGMIRAEGCDEGGYGASLSLENVFVYTDPVYDTGGEWQYVEMYGRTAPDQTGMTVFARVGGYGTLARGRASFDNLEVVELDEAPEGAVVNEFYREAAYDDDDDDDDGGGDDGDAMPARNTESWLLFTCVYALAVIGFVRKRDRSALAPEPARLRLALWLGLAAALILRLVLAARVRGYNTDINCFTGWSERMYSMGAARFYDPQYFCDYPPGYMLMLWPVAALRRLLGLQANGGAYLILLKLMPILADVGGAALVWRVTRRKLGEAGAVALALLTAFNPAAMANSAAWGQIDAVLTLAVALCAIEAADGRYLRALLWFGAAMLVKPQALLFAPVGLTAIACGIARCEGDDRRRALRQALTGVGACLALLYAVAFVCCLGRADGALQALTLPVKWLAELYSGTVQGYQYVTVNTLNLYYLLGLNWAPADAHAAVTGLAWALFGLSYVFCIALTVLSRSRPRRLLLTGGLLIVLVCVFGPMIHERYVYPGLLLLTLAFAEDRDRRLLIGLTVLTATLFLNEVLVLQGGMTEANYGHLYSGEHWLNCLLSAVNVLNALFLGWTAADICVRDHVWPLRRPEREGVPAGAYTLAEAPNYRLNLKRSDALLIAAVTLLYSLLAFTNLGVTDAPQTGWTSSRSGESVVFDLGQTQTWQMTYYGGICNSTFTVELSDDGETWNTPRLAQYNQGEIFRWLWFSPLDENMNVMYNAPEGEDDAGVPWHYAGGSGKPMQTARYARITARSAGLVLYEVALTKQT